MEVRLMNSWSTFHDRVESGLDETLASLGTDYLDLYLVHWPMYVPRHLLTRVITDISRLIPNGTSPVMPLKEDGTRNIDTEWDQAKTWAQMEDVLAKGKVKAIGVSNVSEILLEELSKTWKVVPAVNQVGTVESV
jgi:glycerol 2-dehydrogenase (NADP+)